MNAYHISYAAEPGSDDRYVRGRRYSPDLKGIKGSGLKSELAEKLRANLRIWQDSVLNSLVGADYR